MSSLSFETKLSAVTGLDFKDAGDHLKAERNKSFDLDTTMFYQMRRAGILCEYAKTGDHATFTIDKSMTNPEAFDSFCKWKQRDIAEGVENAALLSQKTGFELNSELGFITLFNEATHKVLNEAVNIEEIDHFIQAGRDKGYDWRFIQNESHKNDTNLYNKNGIALFKKTWSLV